jgi:hypothetical protein
VFGTLREEKDESLTHPLGTSNQCEPCRRGDEEHIQRHREIAEIIHELKQLKQQQQGPTSPLSPRSINAFATAVESAMTKKERKVAKKAKKISEMAKVVSSGDIDFVSKVLHPNEPDVNEIDIERQLVEDPDIQLNRFFHKGTSNTRDVRNQFVKKHERKAGGKEELHVDPEELDGLLQLLNVSPLTSKSSAEEKVILTDLREKIEDDLIREQREKELMMQRKRGFWRWASKKAYKRLVQNGRIWSEKDGNSQASRSDETTTSSSSAVGGAEADSTEPDSDTGPPSEDSISEAMSILKLGSDPATLQAAGKETPRKIKDMNDGWTTVGKPGKVKTPAGKVKLMHNKGLDKIGNSPSTHGFFSSMLERENDA